MPVFSRDRIVPTRALVMCLLALWAGVASAYTIVFNDGSSQVVMTPYTVAGDRAVVTLPSGTQTSFPLAEIDTERTEEVNRFGVQRGILLDRYRTNLLTEADAEDTAREPTTKERLLEMVDLGSLPKRPERRVRKTHAGNLDLFTLERRSASPEASAALETALHRTGMRVYRIFAGTSEDRLLLDAAATNEAEVFSTLERSAAAFLQADLAGIRALNIILSSQDRVRAAQFVLTRDAARQLLDGDLTPAEFFLLHVQF